MSGDGLTTDLVFAGQEHTAPAGAHLVLLAGIVIVALAIFGVKWWRGRRDAARRTEEE